MLKYLNLLVCVLSCIAISACSGVNFSEWHFPYMMPVEQGTIITEKQYEALKIGMTKEEVTYIIGSPLTQFLFNQNRWDYTYQLYKNNKLQKHYDVVILFSNNKVTYINKTGKLFDK